MKSVYKYRIYCNSEQHYVYTWNDELPTVCPNNGTHDIDTTSISIVETVSSNETIVTQELKPTGCNYRVESRLIETAPNATETDEIDVPYDITLLNFSFYTTPVDELDEINVFIGENTVIGVNVSSVTSGNTQIPVSSTVITNINIGYGVNITDGINCDNLGECLGIDRINNIITVETPTVHTFNTNSYIRMTIQPVKGLILQGGVCYELAKKSLQGSSIPKEAKIKMVYTNKSLITAKKLFAVMEYLY